MNLIILLILAAVLIAKGIIIVQQQEEVIIQRLGRYEKTLKPGLNFIIPFFDVPRLTTKRFSQKDINGNTFAFSKQTDRIDLRETVFDFPRQNVITKDNVSIAINALIYFQIVDAKAAVYEIENLPEAIEKLTQTTLRNLVGQLELQETLVSRDKINTELRIILDDAAGKWGVKVNRVELQDIITPTDIQAAMDKQMKAEREKRAMIYEAEGQKEAAIRVAEGQKQAAILSAEGVAQARVIEADAEKEAINRIITALESTAAAPDKYLIAISKWNTTRFLQITANYYL